VPVKDSARKSAKLINGAQEIYYPGAPHGLTATHQIRSTPISWSSSRAKRLQLAPIARRPGPAWTALCKCAVPWYRRGAGTTVRLEAPKIKSTTF
jgi:hypothetical protein